jgi:Fic family protein
MDAPWSHDIEAAGALMLDPVFAALAEEAVRDYLDWDELTRRPLPAGLSAEDTWRLLTIIRRFGGTEFPIPDIQGRVWWYTLTREATLCVNAIERYCRADSTVHRAILHRHGRRLMVASRIREATAVCRLEGVVIRSKDAENLLMTGRAPRNATERLVLNAHALLYEVDALFDEPFSPEMLNGLYARLMDGIDVCQIERHKARHGLRKDPEQNPVSPEEFAKVVRQFCAYANGQTGDPSQPVAMKAHDLLNFGHFWNSFPDYTGIIGRCLFRLYAARHGYPVLGCLPISSTYLSWTQGRISSPLIRFRSLPAPRSESDTGGDYTADALTYLQLTVAALDELLMSIDHARRQDAQVRTVLEHDPEVNYRQRTIISQALAEPDIEFRIREHQTTHNVVYATARADLMDLVDRGYLYQEQRGKAFVFLPTTDLVDRLDKAAEAEAPA